MQRIPESSRANLAGAGRGVRCVSQHSTTVYPEASLDSLQEACFGLRASLLEEAARTGGSRGVKRCSLLTALPGGLDAVRPPGQPWRSVPERAGLQGERAPQPALHLRLQPALCLSAAKAASFCGSRRGVRLRRCRDPLRVLRAAAAPAPSSSLAESRASLARQLLLCQGGGEGKLQSGPDSSPGLAGGRGAG